MGKLGGKIRNAATQAYSKRFSQEDIMNQSMTGEHNGEPMARVYARIMSDPAIKREATKKPGLYDLVYESNGREAVVGWMDMNRTMGEISQKAYDHVQNLSEDGCYVIKKGDEYAVRAYTEGLGKNGKYVVENKDPEANPKFTFADDNYTNYPTYDDASHAAYESSVQLGIKASYDAPDYGVSDELDEQDVSQTMHSQALDTLHTPRHNVDASLRITGPNVDDGVLVRNDIPSTGGFDPHRDNAGGEYDMDPNFRLDSAEPSLDESQMGE